MPRFTTRNSHRHGTERAALRLGERTYPLCHSLETRAVVRRQSGERPIELGAVEEQRVARRHVAEPLRVFAQRRVAARSYRFHNRRGDGECLRRNPGGTTPHQLGDRTTG